MLRSPKEIYEQKINLDKSKLIVIGRVDNEKTWLIFMRNKEKTHKKVDTTKKDPPRPPLCSFRKYLGLDRLSEL